MLNNRRGASNIGCLLILVLVAAGCYVGYRFALVQWNLETFKEKMTEITRFWAERPKIEDTGAVKEDVINKAEQCCSFELMPEDITVDVSGQDVAINVSWLEPIEFPGGFTYERPITVSRRIKKLGY